MKKGFTLIELLVVVLIIGILAAVALPQYTKAVERSRMSEAVQFLGDLATAQSIYYMQRNAFAGDLTALNGGDITLTAPDATNRWALQAFADSAADETHGTGKTMTLQRAKGTYAGGQLSITVYPDGFISKACGAAENTLTGTDATEFCALGDPAGY